MRKIGYALQFKGKGGPKRGSKDMLTAKSSSSTGSIATSVGARGPRITIKDSAKEVKAGRGGAFTEWGTIDFGAAGKLKFTTIGKGQMGPSPVENVMHGTIMWQVDGGTKTFRGATGLITSNFTFSSEGDIVDNQWGVIYVK
jgi:hypothetical protein